MVGSEVMQMDARVRILAIRLMETIRKDPVYARSLGIEVGVKKRFECSMNSYLQAEGVTEL